MAACRTCIGAQQSLREVSAEIVHLVRIAEKNPGTPGAKNGLVRIKKLKERNVQTRSIIAACEAADHRKAS